MEPDSNPTLDFLVASLGFSLKLPGQMDDDDLSALETPQEIDSPLAVQGQMERQLETLKGYLDALPYECEAPEEMQTKLEFIIGKMDVCIRSKNWSLLPNWSQLLHWCVIPTTTTCFRLNLLQLVIIEISDPCPHTG